MGYSVMATGYINYNFNRCADCGDCLEKMIKTATALESISEDIQAKVISDSIKDAWIDVTIIGYRAINYEPIRECLVALEQDLDMQLNCDLQEWVEVQGEGFSYNMEEEE